MTNDAPSEATEASTPRASMSRAGAVRGLGDLLVGVLVAAVTLLALASWGALLPQRMAAYLVSPIEAQPVWAVTRAMADEPMYRDYATTRPVVPLTYGALTYGVPALLAPLLPDAILSIAAPGAAAMERTEGLRAALAGRFVSLLAFPALVLICGVLAARRGARWWLAPFAATPLLWFPLLGEAFWKFAPDAAALAWSLGGLLLAESIRRRASTAAAIVDHDNHRQGRDMRGLSLGLAACLCWTIAFHYKPTIVAGPLAWFVGAVTRWRRDGFRSRDLLLPVATLAMTAAACVWLMIATDGLWWTNAIGSLANNPMSLRYAWGNLIGMEWPALCALTALLVAAAFRARAGDSLGVAVWIAFALEFALMAKRGSNTNYLMGTVALGGIALAAHLAHAPWRMHRVAALPLLLMLPFFAPSHVQQIGAPTHPMFYVESRESIAAFFGDGSHTVRILAPDARMLTEITVADPAGVDATFGTQLFADPFHATLLEEAGVVSFADEAARLERAEYSVVMTTIHALAETRFHDQLVFPDSLGAPLRRHYAPVGVSAQWFVVWERRAAR